MGFRGKYQTKATDSRFISGLLHELCHHPVHSRRGRCVARGYRDPTAAGNSGQTKISKCCHGKSSGQLAASVTCCLCLRQARLLSDFLRTVAEDGTRARLNISLFCVTIAGKMIAPNTGMSSKQIKQTTIN